MHNSETNYDFINFDYLNALLEDDNETKATMLTILLDELPDEIQKINTAFHENNITAIKNAAHKLKSTLAFVGNEKMATANKAIEQITKNNEGLEKLPELIEVLNTIQASVLKEVKLAVESMG